MSEHPNPLADERLRHFLRQYRPLPPPAASGLEEQILQVVATHPLHGRLKHPWRWVGISLLAGALIIIICLVSYRRKPPLAGSMLSHGGPKNPAIMPLSLLPWIFKRLVIVISS